MNSLPRTSHQTQTPIRLLIVPLGMKRPASLPSRWATCFTAQRGGGRQGPAADLAPAPQAPSPSGRLPSLCNVMTRARVRDGYAQRYPVGARHSPAWQPGQAHAPSSPQMAVAMACRISAVGCVTVSLRRSIIGMVQREDSAFRASACPALLLRTLPPLLETYIAQLA
jgi:hypothetical protein